MVIQPRHSSEGKGGTKKSCALNPKDKGTLGHDECKACPITVTVRDLPYANHTVPYCDQHTPEHTLSVPPKGKLLQHWCCERLQNRAAHTFFFDA